MKKANRIVMIMAVIVLCLSVLGSASCLAFHSHHHCTGENCSVCVVITQCDQRLRSAAVSGSSALLLLCYAALAAFLTGAETREASCETLVSLKVEMLN